MSLLQEIRVCNEIISLVGIDMYFNKGFSHWYPPYSLNSFIENNKSKTFFLGYLQNKPIAVFALSESDNSYPIKIWGETHRSIFLSKLAILPSYQSIGLGSFCLDFVYNYAVRNNRSSILLDILATHNELRRFYRKNGYHELKKISIVNRRGIKWPISLFEKKINSI